ncbi:hypothetical protein GJ496_011743 [Pomphorhynchus laevis]|nr:hypothetical protein GJ496_011743 [Pomphorhynchus laevis]
MSDNDECQNSELRNEIYPQIAEATSESKNWKQLTPSHKSSITLSTSSNTSNVDISPNTQVKEDEEIEAFNNTIVHNSQTTGSINNGDQALEQQNAFDEHKFSKYSFSKYSKDKLERARQRTKIDRQLKELSLDRLQTCCYLKNMIIMDKCSLETALPLDNEYVNDAYSDAKCLVDWINNSKECQEDCQSRYEKIWVITDYLNRHFIRSYLRETLTDSEKAITKDNSAIAQDIQNNMNSNLTFVPKSDWGPAVAGLLDIIITCRYEDCEPFTKVQICQFFDTEQVCKWTDEFLHSAKFVPQQEAWVIERMGKFHKILNPGLNFLLPIVDTVKYVQSMKEIAIEVPQQSAITKDNVTLHLDGVLYLKVVDPYKASYGVEDPEFAVTQLAQTTMRSEIGKISLDNVFRERDSLNIAIVGAINKASNAWGISCMRYEIRDIKLPQRVHEAMIMQVEAERKKRAAILESEGVRESAINTAEGRKSATILNSEAIKMDQINKATGEAEAIIARAQATTEALHRISKALSEENGKGAAALSVAEQYVKAFGQIAKTSNTVLLPTDTGNISSMVSQAFAIYKSVDKTTNQTMDSIEHSPSMNVDPPTRDAPSSPDVKNDSSLPEIKKTDN